VPTGNPNSTLLSELNRLANGGTYPPVNTLDEAAAARAWAEREGIVPTTTDTVGLLNEIAGLARGSWLDYSGVCNYLAGTTGLPAAAALRQLTGTPQITTPGAPVLLIATPGNESATINWAPPADEGSAPVDKYRITVVDHPEFLPVEVASGPYTFIDLTNGVLYFFTVEAHNSFGWGPAATSPGATPAFIEYPATFLGNSIYYYQGWIVANDQPYNGFPASWRYDDGTVIRQLETKIVVGNTYPNAAGWGQSNYVIQPDGYYGVQYISVSDTGINYSSTVTITPAYNCPNGGLFDPSTNMCVETLPSAVVTGGTLSEDSNYYYRTFLASDTLTISNAALTNAEILLIAGGGFNGPGEFWCGAARNGGGGGAGGLINETVPSLELGSYSVIIGAGGGNDSSLTGSSLTKTAIGGGQGANLYYTGAGSGGSGGGGDWGGGGGAGTAGQGYNGGNGYRTSGCNAASGGGGGAGQAGSGAVVSGDFNARGGNGLQFSDWATATSTGVNNGYYAGGGGGRWSNDDIGADGLGGGGGANTGSGGTVSRHGPGSGLFIIRWAK
jgi:hypothetical protein